MPALHVPVSLVRVNMVAVRGQPFHDSRPSVTDVIALYTSLSTASSCCRRAAREIVLFIKYKLCYCNFATNAGMQVVLDLLGKLRWPGGPVQVQEALRPGLTVNRIN